MFCHYSEEVVACLQITIYDVLSAAIAAHSVFPTDYFELQLPVTAVTAVYFFNDLRNSRTFFI